MQTLSAEQRAAHYRFHSRVYRRLLRFPRLLIINGDDPERDFFIPLLAGGGFQTASVSVDCALGTCTGTVNVGFVRPVGGHWSIVLRRRHPQGLDISSHPARQTRLLYVSVVPRDSTYRVLTSSLL